MGAFFAASSFHFFLILKPFEMTDAAGLYTGLFCFAGLLAYVWTLLPDHIRPSHGYNISDVVETGGALAVTLKPQRNGLKPVPGQFGIFRFSDTNMNEPHPFSFSKINADGSLRVTIKPLGDFTSQLKTKLKGGQEVHVQGPFGRFQLTIRKPQVWVAGGIGITPFLAWADSLTPDAPTTHLFYCFRSETEAPHLSEIENLAESKPNLTLHLFNSSKGERLDIEDIAKKVDGVLNTTKVSFCGPAAMRNVLQTGLKKYGVGARNFHYEEFEFRTGIGLKKLGAWIVKSAHKRVN